MLEDIRKVLHAFHPNHNASDADLAALLEMPETTAALEGIKAGQLLIMTLWKQELRKREIEAFDTTLPNATVGKPYRVPLDNVAFGLNDNEVFAIDTPEKSGLHYADGILSGIPVEAGNTIITLRYGLDARGESMKEGVWYNKTLTLLINPDPRSLWLDLPSDAAGEYAKPDSDSAHIETGEHHIIAASVRGRSHGHEGKYRDDDFRIRHNTENGWSMLVVADGAGSAKFSRRGAQIACQTVVDYLGGLDETKYKNLEDNIAQHRTESPEKVKAALYLTLVTAAKEASDAIALEAQQHKARNEGSNTEIKDFATTLLVAVAKQFEFGYFIGTFSVGDGGIGLYVNAQTPPVLLCASDSGEYAGQTRFLTMPEIFSATYQDIIKRVYFHIVEPVTDAKPFTALLLMTDGVTDPFFDTDTNFADPKHWETLWQSIDEKVSLDTTPTDRTAAELLDWLGFWSVGNHDDRTIAILY